ncbi:MAG: low molecular weight phosphotyrosine protein phosphatase [Bdellovibrionales bacterium]|nr:low molecular weight phosphotyrosine protein phosphatase [Bdellovibrionales bacterium]
MIFVKPLGVLFVCLGNICRSPLAAEVFRHHVSQHGLDSRFHIDSCGTGGWHVGERAHSGSLAVAKKHGISLDSHRARQLSREDFRRFDLFVALDRSNYAEIIAQAGVAAPEVVLLRQFEPSADDLDVPDPYYLPRDSFEEVFRIIDRAAEGLLHSLQNRL